MKNEKLVKGNIVLTQQIDQLTEGFNKCALELKNTKDEYELYKTDTKNNLAKLIGPNPQSPIPTLSFNINIDLK